jgi:two-component system alkaline phosphatase synthesis response regulator PhoP
MLRNTLIIDDDADSIMLLQTGLTDLGYSVTSVNDISRIEKTPARMDGVNLIFLDLKMPKDGLEIYQKLRNQGIRAPIIAYTAFVERRRDVYKAGFDGLIPKPLDVSTLPAILEKIRRGESLW